MNRIEIAGEIVKAAGRHGVPPELALLMAERETGIQHTDAEGEVIKSGAGALGVMQLMPRTAEEMRLDPMDLKDNIEGGVRYLAQMYVQFGDWKIAAAAYNCGPGNMNKFLQGKIPLPLETEAYIKRIFGRPFGEI